MRKHIKTRTGCMTCRRRRVKCDEKRPNCDNCTQRKLECSYFNHLGSSGSAPQGLLGLAPLHSCWPSQALPPPCPRLLDLEMGNLELFHHFTTSTYATLTTDEHTREIWRLVVPRVAFSYEFVMRALLAMSALHLRFLKSRDMSYDLAATQHHLESLKLLRVAFPVLNQQHADALLAANTLIAMYAYAYPPVVESMLPKAPTWIPVIRDGSKIIQGCWNWVRGGVLAPLLGRAEADQSRYVGETIDFPSSLFILSQPGAPGELDPEELEDGQVLEIYRDATELLKASWDHFWPFNPKEVYAFRWPSLMSDEFMRFIEELRPRALVLLAHHCAMMELLDDRFWWIKGRGVDEIRRIEGVLEEKWKPWLDWPKMRCEILKRTG